MLLPSAVLAVLAFAPAIAGRDPVQRHTLIAAAALGCTGLALWFRRDDALVLRFEPRRPHYMQAITQIGVYAWWGYAWAPVAPQAWLIALQIVLAYQVELLVCWWRGRVWRGGFGPLPIVLSVNLFLWFRDERFIWQLALVALCYLGKELVRWQRDGQTRHVFNPSSFGLALASAGLLLAGATDATFAREIALTQEDTPHIWQALFALGLIVQLQFPVVLVTASAALATWLCSLAFFAISGVYLFGTTDIPAAVLLGMLLLITDPATSPTSRGGKVMFGASYGVLVFALYAPLEAWGSYGYFDKLLPVPLLNLLVRRFDGWGRAIETRFEALTAKLTSNLAHVGAWGMLFGAMLVGDAFGAGHPGRDIAFWQQACQERRYDACETLLNLLTASCDGGEMRACHNLGVELQLAVERGDGADNAERARAYFTRACDAGIAPSCAALGRPVDAGAGAAPPLEAQLEDNTVLRQRCDAGDMSACNNLAALAMQASTADKREAAEIFERACDAGDSRGCANLALMYWRGDFVAQDLPRAAGLHQKACDGGLGLACARLADAYRDGLGVGVDAERASRLRALACQLGHAAACSP